MYDISELDTIFSVPEPRKSYIESGMDEINSILTPSYSSTFTYRDFEEAADQILHSEFFSESSLYEINKILGYNESFETEELKPYLIESLQLLCEAADKKVNVEELKKDIKKKVEELDKKPDAPHGLVIAWASLLYLLIFGTTFGGGVAGFMLGGPVGMLIGEIGGAFLGGWIGSTFLAWLTTYIYNKISDNNVASPTEKARAINKMCSELDKICRKLDRQGESDKVKQLNGIKEDLIRKAKGN